MTRDDADALDAADPLAAHRDAFAMPRGLIYLDGNSLGPLPHAARARVEAVMRDEWGCGLIASWEAAGWMEQPVRVGDKIARILGAAAGEIVVADSTSVNLFKIAAAAVSLRPGRSTLLVEEGNFPTDRHVVDGLARLVPGLRVVAAPIDALAGLLDGDTAAILLCQVHYRSGLRLDMRAWSDLAHAVGALSLWDLSHGAGAVATDLHAGGADMAAGCGYKFLNGGPGAPAFLYVSRALQEAARSPVQGWIGHSAPFGFSDVYTPGAGVRRFLSGTPGVLGLAALEAAVDVFLAADAAALWEKSARMFDLFVAETACCGERLRLLTPRAAAARGSHVAFACADAAGVMRRLAARGVVGDYRPPDVVRFGLTPLYTRFAELWHAAAVLREVL